MSVSLSYSLFSRRFQGLIAKLFHRDQRHRFKPLHKATLSEFDLMGQAQLLMKAHYYIAGAMLLRSYIERRVLCIVLVTVGAENVERKNFHAMLVHLHKLKLITEKTLRLAETLWHALCKTVHTGAITPSQAQHRMNEARVFQARLHKAAKLALRCAK